MIRAVEVVRVAGMHVVVMSGGCTDWYGFVGRVVRESKSTLSKKHLDMSGGCTDWDGYDGRVVRVSKSTSSKKHLDNYILTLL